MTTELSFKPIKRNLWTDFEELFGPHGACGGCWCMYWKLRGKEYEETRGFETRQMHKSIVDSGVATGLLAYLHGDVVCGPEGQVLHWLNIVTPDPVRPLPRSGFARIRTPTVSRRELVPLAIRSDKVVPDRVALFSSGDKSNAGQSAVPALASHGPPESQCEAGNRR